MQIEIEEQKNDMQNLTMKYENEIDKLNEINKKIEREKAMLLSDKSDLSQNIQTLTKNYENEINDLKDKAEGTSSSLKCQFYVLREL